MAFFLFLSMVSTLWKACQDGDDHRVDELLNDTNNTVDLEIKGQLPSNS